MKHFFTALAFGIAATAMSGPAHAQTLSIGSNPQGSLAFTVASAIARVASENTDYRVRVVPQGGPEVTIPLVQTGELEFSIASSDIGSAAATGRGSFEGRQMANVRLVTNLMVFNSGVFVRADSGIQTFEDLKGKKLPGEFPQQKVLDGYLRTTLTAAGLSVDDVTLVPAPNGGRGVEDFVSGAVDGAIFSPGSGAVAQADVAVGGIRFLALPETPETDATIREMTPGAFLDVVEPRDNRPGIEGPTPMMAGTFVLLAGANTPDEAVEAILAALRDNRDDLKATFPGLAQFQDTLMAQSVEGLPRHDGAASYLQSQGLAPSE